MKKYIMISMLMLLMVPMYSIGLNQLQPINIATDQYKFDKSIIEFIGFKNLTSVDRLTKNFDFYIKKVNIAIDNTSIYHGDYSLEDLSNYQSKTRYISYIEVLKQSFVKNDSYLDEKIHVHLGGVAGLIQRSACDKNLCAITLECVYKIHIYDSELKAIIYNTTETISVKDIYDSEYSFEEDRVKSAVYSHYRGIIFNKLLEQYAKIYPLIDSLQE